MHMTDAEGLGRTARLDVLFTGYVGERVAGTVSLVRDGDGDTARVIVVDPGMVPSRSAILEPLAALGVEPGDVTDVVISHHHPDHTVNIALFGGGGDGQGDAGVPVHDFQAVYAGDVWTRRSADGVDLTPSVRLLTTPGHTPQDITVLVGTPDAVVALTHAWWTEDGPESDPYAPDPDQLAAQRERIAGLVDRVVPGHGAPFDVRR
jgi:glyoxylase-like metal-dependent hydrolase (beta-lactamase superfamily II)